MRHYVEACEAAGVDPAEVDTAADGVWESWLAAPRRRRVDAAIEAYRAEPTEARHAELMAAAEASTEGFYAEQTDEFIRRTRGPR